MKNANTKERFERMRNAMGIPVEPVSKTLRTLQRENAALKEQLAEQAAAILELAELVARGEQNG